MERVLTVRLRAMRDGSLGESIARLRALRHRAQSFTQRDYEFHSDPALRAVARGAYDPIVAYAESVINGDDTFSIVDRRPVPAAYLDWAAARAVRTVKTVEFLITHKLRVCVADAPASCGGDAEVVFAEIRGAQDFEKHAHALQSMCETAGFSPVALPHLSQTPS